MKGLDLETVSPGVPIVGWLLDGPQPEFTDVVSIARRWMADGQRVTEVIRAEDYRGMPMAGPGRTVMRACGLAGRG
ncbi:hypothetical protein JL37_17305 [Achromobacter sp. RTa]|uniref:hypothetical protein n=1 Tax=Achromobacter sp. RTa TaxID=1532557 RepID=UPI00050ECAD5|nr:hypothetical protein [Achromobacter sp. RTa]KGD92402.1 hypothetical protein JL37_17305 [Achromobacter sp. RTa]